MNTEQAEALLRKYNSGQCTEAEKALIEKSFFAFHEEDIEVSFKKLKALRKQISKGLPKPITRTSSLKISIAISTAAAVIAFAMYVFMPSPENDINKSLSLAEKVFPKGNVALITLSNGKTIELDKKKEEIKVNGSNLNYNDGSKVNNYNPTEFQTISTPKGGEYKIVLSDGTKVWLNAATVLQYPTSFRERAERRVKLVSGEAYFEVSKDKKHPFIVSSSHQDVTVLGTTFDINSYTKEVKTTLLEGSVKLTTSAFSKQQPESLLLLPGEQSVNIGERLSKKTVDTDLEIAWKNGRIKFRDAYLSAILIEAERWYNIVVSYEGKIPDLQLTGGISRKSSLATLLKLLQMSGIHFNLTEKNGKRILSIKSPHK